MEADNNPILNRDLEPAPYSSNAMVRIANSRSGFKLYGAITAGIGIVAIILILSLWTDLPQPAPVLLIVSGIVSAIGIAMVAFGFKGGDSWHSRNYD